MLKHRIEIAWSPEQNGYMVAAPELDECCAFGRTPEEAIKQIQMAIENHEERKHPDGESHAHSLIDIESDGMLVLRDWLEGDEEPIVRQRIHIKDVISQHLDAIGPEEDFVVFANHLRQAAELIYKADAKDGYGVRGEVACELEKLAKKLRCD